MADRVRNPEPDRAATGNPDLSADLPQAPPPAQQPIVQPQPGPDMTWESETPTLPGGFRIMDTEQTTPVWDVRSGALVDADDLATSPEGSTVMSGNVIVKGGSIASDNFVEGASGWEIAHDGTAEFNNVAVRGMLAGIDGPNLMPNGTFDTNLSGWEAADPASAISRVTAGQRTGAGALQVKCISASTISSEAIYDLAPIAVKPGQAYRLTGWGKATNRRVGMFFIWFDASMTNLGSHACTENYARSSWVPINGTAIAPAGAVWLAVYVYFGTLSGFLTLNETALFDDIIVNSVSDMLVGRLRTGDTGDRMEVVSGGGTQMSWFTGDPDESVPGTLIVDTDSDTGGNRFGRTVLRTPVLGPDSTGQGILALYGRRGTNPSTFSVTADAAVIGKNDNTAQVFVAGSLSVAGTVTGNIKGLLVDSGAASNAGLAYPNGSAAQEITGSRVTLANPNQTVTIEASGGGYVTFGANGEIFDQWIEISTNGGTTWTSSSTGTKPAASASAFSGDRRPVFMQTLVKGVFPTGTVQARMVQQCRTSHVAANGGGLSQADVLLKVYSA